MILMTVAPAFAGGGYYQKNIGDCNPAAIRAELDRATIEGRAVTTVVTCNPGANIPQHVTSQRYEYAAPRYAVAVPACIDCARPVERVVNREYFVRETVQTYQPVVTYVPSGTYTTTRSVCGNDFGC